MDPMGKGMISTFSLHDLRRAARDQSWPGPRSRWFGKTHWRMSCLIDMIWITFLCFCWLVCRFFGSLVCLLVGSFFLFGGWFFGWLFVLFVCWFFVGWFILFVCWFVCWLVHSFCLLVGSFFVCWLGRLFLWWFIWSPDSVLSLHQSIMLILAIWLRIQYTIDVSS